MAAEKKNFKTEDGTPVAFEYKEHATAEGRENVWVKDTQVGYLYEEDDVWSVFINPVQEGGGAGTFRELGTNYESKKDAAQALAEALGKHADVNVLSQ